MLYGLEYGKIEQNIISQALRNKREVPEAIQNAPELQPHLRLYLDAFNELNSERQVGMGVGLIPWSSIHRYAKHYNFCEDVTERLHLYLKGMDIEYLNFQDRGK